MRPQAAEDGAAVEGAGDHGAGRGGAAPDLRGLLPGHPEGELDEAPAPPAFAQAPHPFP